jgi:uncharacterized NAD-dependent epimerase/dehydratase family protein
MTGFVRIRNGKMGFGLLRYSENPIACVIAADEVGVPSASAGSSAPLLRELTGIDTDVPIVADVAAARALGADTLVIAVATSGGILPDGYREAILSALRLGMNVVNGLHGRYADDPEYQAALEAGRGRRQPMGLEAERSSAPSPSESAWIWDVRTEPTGLFSGRGRARALPARRVLTVGTDMAIGKMTASLELDRAARARGLRSKFLATGQIGICISGDGVPLDAVRVDFASGSIEGLCVKYGHDHDVLWVEGQGSALHPGSTAWVPLLRGSMATDLVLVHRAGQTVLDGFGPALGGGSGGSGTSGLGTDGSSEVVIPPLREVIALYEAAAAASPSFPAAKVRGIALNCARLSPAEIDAACAEVEAETGLVCIDVVHHGAARLLEAVIGGKYRARRPGQTSEGRPLSHFFA